MITLHELNRGEFLHATIHIQPGLSFPTTNSYLTRQGKGGYTLSKKVREFKKYMAISLKGLPIPPHMFHPDMKLAVGYEFFLNRPDMRDWDNLVKVPQDCIFSRLELDDKNIISATVDKKKLVLVPHLIENVNWERLTFMIRKQELPDPWPFKV